MNRRHTVVLQKKKSARRVKHFPIRGGHEPLQPLPPSSNAVARHTAACPSRGEHVGSHRQAPRATATRPGAQPPRWSALGVHSPGPGGRAARLSSTPCLPCLFGAASRSPDTADALGQQCVAPSAPPGRRLRGPRKEWSAIQGTPRAPLSPRSRSTAGSRPRSPRPRVPAAAGGARATLGWRREEVPRAQGWVLWLTQHLPPGSRANGAGSFHLPEALSSPERDSLVFPAA